MARMAVIWLGLGANRRGRWGSPPTTLARAAKELQRHGLIIEMHSLIYHTRPLGRSRQPCYCNAVLGVRGSIAPAALLRLAKRLERAAGRRPSARWEPRPLDIDILDFGGRTIGHPAAATRHDRLILPHPGLAQRGFVLVPLAEVAPGWRHPLLGVGARALLSRRPRLRREVLAVQATDAERQR